VMVPAVIETAAVLTRATATATVRMQWHPEP
jgi:hypothetical protein